LKTSHLVVTGCDAAHFDLAEDMVTSFRAVCGADYQLGFVRFCETPLPDQIAARVDLVVNCTADYQNFADKPGFYTAYAAIKPRLPKLFAGFDIYSWIDADCWLQNPLTLKKMALASGSAALCIHPETDVHYTDLLPSDRTLSVYPKVMGARPSSEQMRTPMLNSGVFSAHASSPIWSLWEQELLALRRRFECGQASFYSDQIPLHHLIYRDRIQVARLRATDNWQTYAALPRLDCQTGQLVVPSFPFEPISIIHLAGKTKHQTYDMGVGEPLSLRYRRLQQWLAKHAPSATVT